MEDMCIYRKVHIKVFVQPEYHTQLFEISVFAQKYYKI